MEQKIYHYTDSGLDNIYLVGVAPELNDAGEEIITIPGYNELFEFLETMIVTQNAGMNGQELRLIRTEMGMTQEKLAEIIHKDKQTIGRWERGETPIEGASEALIRLLAVERLHLNIPFNTEELAQRSGNPMKKRTPLYLIFDEVRMRYDVQNRTAPQALKAA